MRFSSRELLAALCLAAILPASGLASSAKGKPVVGKVTDVVSTKVVAGGREVKQGQTRSLVAKDRLSTDADGEVRFRVSSGKKKLECRSSTSAQVQVLPRKGVLIDYKRGRHHCVTSVGGGNSRTLSGRVVMDFADPVFEVSVTKKATVVKVGRGRIVVYATNAASSSVAVGRNQQTTVAAGSQPTEATKAVLTQADKKIFNQLAATLPPDKDKLGPATTLSGPRNPSSLHVATFSFTSEPNAILSCSFDGAAFRVCTSPMRFENLPAGDHRFEVRATDGSGNVGATASYPWRVDGSKILFTSERGQSRDIWVMDTDGSGQTNLTGSSGGLDDDPAWSPDRRQIAFHSDRDGNMEIYVMNADGSGVQRLTRNGERDRNPAWSPDGRRIVFESFRDNGNREIYVMNADGSGQTRVTTAREEDFDPDWSPDGSKIAFASNRDGNYEIYVMNADGSGVQRLTNTPQVEFNPAWSPDGKQIAFMSLRNGISHQIYVMNADGSNQHALPGPTGFDDDNPAWAPDGGEIVFQSNRDRGSGGDSEIYVMNADGSGQSRLTTSPKDDLVPDW